MAGYGLDVRDPAAVSPRRLAVLLDHLPPSARRPGQQWSTEAELLAVVIDHLAQLTWVTAKAAGAKNLARPTPVRRPGDRYAAPPPRPAEPGRAAPPGSVKAGTWAEAVAVLAGLPGVEVLGDG